MPTYINSLNNAILRANIDPKVMGNPSAYGNEFFFLINYVFSFYTVKFSKEF